MHENTVVLPRLDQALAVSVVSYSADVSDSRDLFIGVLGHDLRGPLSAIKMSNLLLERPNLSETARVSAAARSGRAVNEMSRLISDLLDYTRSRLGAGIPIERADCDLEAVCRDALDAIQASHPDVRFELKASGDLRMQADSPKLGQALANLLGNAVQYSLSVVHDSPSSGAYAGSAAASTAATVTRWACTWSGWP